MGIVVKFLLGIIYATVKSIILPLCFIIGVLWYMNAKDIKELYKELYSVYSVFYVYCLFHSIELYRYNTLMDFVFDRKDFTHRFKF